MGNHIDVVVHGTVINATKYRETAMLRALAGDCPCDPQTKFFPKPSIVLYRIRLEGHGSYLRVGNVTLPIKNIYVLVEIPIAITPPDQTVGGDRIELFMPEYVGWMVIGRPALGLAIHLAYPPGTNPLTLYERVVVPLTLDVVTRGTYYLSNPAKISDITYITWEVTPLTFRVAGGLCMNHADAESFFATTALGAFTAPLVARVMRWRC